MNARVPVRAALGSAVVILGVTVFAWSTTEAPAPAPSSPPAVEPVVSQAVEGLWIGPTELRSLPTDGPAWRRLVAAANRESDANLADQDSSHDIETLAMALVAARTGDPEYRERTVQNLLEVIGTEDNRDASCDHQPKVARSMAVGRNLAAYVIAADLVGLRSAQGDAAAARFRDWVQHIRFRDNCPNTGSDEDDDGEWRDISESHDSSASNGSAMAGGARVAAALYLGDTAEVERAWATFRRYAGDLSVGPPLGFNEDGLTWSHDPGAPTAINPAGSTKGGRSIDGAIVNDMGRGGRFRWPPRLTQYPWEGLQGAYVQAHLLARAGYPAWEIEDRAMLRAVEYLHHVWQQTGERRWWDRADWVKYLANAVYQADLPINGPADNGRNMAWTDWTTGAG